jgi:hypothetical protein
VPVTPTPLTSQPLSVSPTTVTFASVGFCDTTSPVVISNPDAVKVTWKWTSTGALASSSLHWSLDHVHWTKGLPSDAQGIAPNNGSDSLWLYASCSAIKSASPATVKMTDSLGHSYTLQLTTAG